MPNKRKRKSKRAILPKEWTTQNGIGALPDRVRGMLLSCLARLRVGDDMQYKFFNLKFTPGQRQTIAYELLQTGFSYRDVATLLGVTIQGAHAMIQRAREAALTAVGITWIPANFLDDYNMIKADAAWLRAKSEGASTEELEQSARYRAGSLTAKGADLLIDMARSDAIAKALREAAMLQGSGEAPDPIERVNMLQWVFENKVLKQIEPPAEEAETVEVEDGDDTDGQDR